MSPRESSSLPHLIAKGSVALKQPQPFWAWPKQSKPPNFGLKGQWPSKYNGPVALWASLSTFKHPPLGPKRPLSNPIPSDPSTATELKETTSPPHFLQPPKGDSLTPSVWTGLSFFPSYFTKILAHYKLGENTVSSSIVATFPNLQEHIPTPLV